MSEADDFLHGWRSFLLFQPRVSQLRLTTSAGGKIEKMKKTIKCWIEVYRGGGDNPTIWLKEPSKRDKEHCRLYGYKIYPAIITYKGDK